MQFHEVRFPVALSFGSIGGPERRTDVVTLASGFEERNTPWAHSRRRYDAGIGLRSMDDIDALIAFFEARRGQMFGFRWKDWSDFRSCKPSGAVAATDQVIGEGDGTLQVFQLVKRYASGEAVYLRPVIKPVAGSVLVAVDGEEVPVEVDVETGLVTLEATPAVGALVTAGFEFDVPVRFDTDRIHTSAATFQAGEVPDVPVIEVRV
ncbi:TIGR02217 family protein [Marivita sp. S2033]|uniref:phage distal tail protein, Rcc01695 family n=1 Tax=Marivita sp. S2033 TaxID=3373187 RepID=UPI0039819BCD